MDALATAVTVVVLATGQGPAHHVPQVPQQADPLTQARRIYSQAQRIDYLTSSQGRDYWREQLEIQRLKIPGEFRR